MLQANVGDIIIREVGKTHRFVPARVTDPLAGSAGLRVLGDGATHLEIACAGAWCGVSSGQRVLIADEAGRLREYLP